MTARLPLFLLCLALPDGLPGADPSSAFAAANRAYESGDYGAAAAAYETLAREGHHSPDLYYNLGAAKHRLGHDGEAALWMRRALVLDPGLAEARQSLAFLRSRHAYFEFAEGGLDRFLARLPPTFGYWSVSLALWAASLLFAAAALIPRLRPNRPALVTLGIVLLMAAFVAGRASRYRAERLAIENFATVTGREISVLTAPAPDAKTVVALPPGSEVRRLQTAGPWTYAEIPGDLRGWIRSEGLQAVWPFESLIANP